MEHEVCWSISRQWMFATLFSDLSTHPAVAATDGKGPLASTSAPVWVSSLITYAFSMWLSCQVSHLQGQPFTVSSLSKIPHWLPKWCLYPGICIWKEIKKLGGRHIIWYYLTYKLLLQTQGDFFPLLTTGPDLRFSSQAFRPLQHHVNDCSTCGKRTKPLKGVFPPHHHPY